MLKNYSMQITFPSLYAHLNWVVEILHNPTTHTPSNVSNTSVWSVLFDVLALILLLQIYKPTLLWYEQEKLLRNLDINSGLPLQYILIRKARFLPEYCPMVYLLDAHTGCSEKTRNTLFPVLAVFAHLLEEQLSFLYIEKLQYGASRCTKLKTVQGVPNSVVLNGYLCN